VVRAFLLNPAHDASLPHPRLVGFSVVSFVAVDFFRVRRRDAFEDVGILYFGRADHGGANQLMLGVTADVAL